MKHLVLALGILLLPIAAMAHSGGTDSSGGHYCWTDCEIYSLHTGEYHYHDDNDEAVFTYDGNDDIYDLTTAERLHGNILLQVEERGEAWYIRSSDSKRYYMKDGNVAYEMMRFFSLGITDANLERIPSVSDTSQMNSSSSICDTDTFAASVSGEILLQVEQHGEAWYVDPAKCLRIYMEDGDAAYQIMRYLGLGITNADLDKIVVGTWEMDESEENQSEESQPEESVSYSFSGSGSDVTEAFHLNTGLVLVTSTHANGDSNFITELLDSSGDTEEYLTNEIGEYEGTSYGSISQSGEFLLNVQADGDWEFEIIQPVITSFDQTPAHYWSESDDVVGPFYLDAGLHTFEMFHLGVSNFIVELLDEDGHTEEHLANEIDEWSGTQAAGVDQAGYYYLSVMGDLYWSIDIDKED